MEFKFSKILIILSYASIACIIIGLAARIFGFFFLPESAYADSLFHLRIIAEALKTGIIQTPDIFTTPLYYYFGFVFYKITGFSVEMPFIRVIPFLIMIAQIILSYFLLSKLLKDKLSIFAGTAFIVVFPWLVRYSPVNYIDQFSSIFILLFYFLLVRAFEKPSTLNIGLVCFIIPLITLSKITVAVLLPILLISVWFLFSKKCSKLKLSTILFTVFILSIAWFVFSYFSIPSSSIQVSKEISKELPFQSLLPKNLLISFVYFFDFPSESSFNKFLLNQIIPWFFAATIFAIIVLPLALIIIKGILDCLNEKNKILISMLFCVFLMFFLSFYSSHDNNWVFYFRYFIPVVPLVGVFFAKGFENLNSEKKIKLKLKIIIILSLILFTCYSFVVSSLSAIQYKLIEEKEIPLFEAIKELPKNAKIASLNKSRQIWFYTRYDSSQPIGFSIEEKSPEKIYLVLKKENFSHIALSCYNDFWDRKVLKSLNTAGLVSEVFVQDCLAIYKLN